MLSPHEFATLMLVRHAPDQLDMTRAELDTLLERQLVMLEHAAGGTRRAHLTARGRSLLDAFDPTPPAPARRRPPQLEVNVADDAPPPHARIAAKPANDGVSESSA
ncbi:TPA: hypothetical protein U2L37_001744 [Burkholderia multivorans]|nr:hypothetical protein [Burkholderia multivorans]SAJ63573.1 putative preprotein translocase subunit SecA [Burkholderia multivorans]SAJ88360.1 putative preprotein translocase subunit SecA [Burkholderia multivorans]HEM7807620.1 hypothetical protein [Burkholderia multivorans]HEM7813915.1 hypothetical protein [Burkholderia multivorans]HEM7820786.1 hypothetical protein [Burkholderia multivorans]